MNAPSIPLTAATAEPARRLVMTDRLFLSALAMALFFAIDPFGLRLGRISLTKHLPALLLTLTWTLTLVQDHMQLDRPPPLGIPQLFMPLLVLGAFIAVGSGVAKWHFDMDNTFLFTGLYMALAPMAAYLLARSPNHEKLLRQALLMMAASAVVITIQLVLNLRNDPVHHEMEFLVPPMALLMALQTRHLAVRVLGFMFFFLAGFLFRKNTGILAALMLAAYALPVLVLPRWVGLAPLRRWARLYGIFIGVLLCSAVIAFLVHNRDAYLPSGSPVYRMDAYGRAWAEFLASPLWGTGFAKSATEQFTLFDTGVAHNILPTHSDILDLAANGGTVAFGLWVWALIRVARVAQRWALGAQAQRATVGCAHTLALLSLTGVMTYAFNPLLQQPAKAFLLWGSLGLLAGIALLRKRALQPANRQPS